MEGKNIQDAFKYFQYPESFLSYISDLMQDLSKASDITGIHSIFTLKTLEKEINTPTGFHTFSHKNAITMQNRVGFYNSNNYNEDTYKNPKNMDTVNCTTEKEKTGLFCTYLYFLARNNVAKLFLPNSSYIYCQQTSQFHAPSPPSILFNKKRKYSSREDLCQIFHFFSDNNYILIEMYGSGICIESCALQCALGAFLCGFTSVVVVFMPCHITSSLAYDLRVSYKNFLRNSYMKEFASLAFQEICLNNRSSKTMLYNLSPTPIYENMTNKISILEKEQQDYAVRLKACFLHSSFLEETQQEYSINFRENLLNSSLLQSEIASHHALLYVALALLECRHATLEGKFCLLSGSGVQTLQLARALYALHAKPITLGDENGFIYDENGLDMKFIATLLGEDFGNIKENWLSLYAQERHCFYSTSKEEFWDIPAFAYFMGHKDYSLQTVSVVKLLRNGCKCIGENIPQNKQAMYDSQIFNTQSFFSHLSYSFLNAKSSYLDILTRSQVTYIPFALTNMCELLISYQGNKKDVVNEEIMQILFSFLKSAEDARYPVDIFMGIGMHALRQIRQC